MCTEVYRHQHIETGGNLFGLWTTSGSAVIHVVLGPGKNCRRTTTSFHQDIEYMKRVGRFVNDNYMLCHVGEWHSHHSLSLNKPSKGDEQTVRRNFPEGVTKFLVIIANIENKDTIVLSPYFFTFEGRRYEKAQYVVLDSDGPFSNDPPVVEQIQLGAEGRKYRGNYDQNVSKTQTIQGQFLPPHNPSESTLGGSGEPMDTEDSDVFPPEDYGGANATSDNTTSAPVIPSRIQAEPDKNLNDDNKTPSEREVVLKRIYDELKHWFGTESETAFNFETSEEYPGAVEISFKHHYHYWMVHFPTHFPTVPAKLFRSIEKNSVRSNECSYPKIVEPLKDEVSILLSMKNICKACKICKNFTKESLSHKNVSSHSMDKSAVTLNKFVSELKTAFADITKLNVSHSLDTCQATITFMHHNKWWIIELPAQFPDVPAKIYYQFYVGGSQRRDVILYKKYPSHTKDLDSSKLIVEAINCNCFCSKCEDMQR